MERISIVLDPAVLALPPEDLLRDDALGFVERVERWADFRRKKIARISLPVETADVLESDGVMPGRSRLEELFSRFGIREYSVNDVSRMVLSFLQDSDAFPDCFGIRAVDFVKVEVSPNLDRGGRGISLSRELDSCLVLLACLRQAEKKNMYSFAIAAAREPAARVMVTAEITAVETMFGDTKYFDSQAPHIVSGELTLCPEPTDFITTMNEYELFRAGDRIDRLALAIQVRLFKSTCPPETEHVAARSATRESWSLGRDFASSYSKCLKGGVETLPRKVLDAVFEVLSGGNVRAGHTLRTSRGGDAQQRVRKSDGAGAFRHDIDYEYHLHYWKDAQGQIEFANVVPHGDVSISE